MYYCKCECVFVTVLCGVWRGGIVGALMLIALPRGRCFHSAHFLYSNPFGMISDKPRCGSALLCLVCIMHVLFCTALYSPFHSVQSLLHFLLQLPHHHQFLSFALRCILLHSIQPPLKHVVLTSSPKLPTLETDSFSPRGLPSRHLRD